MSLIKIYIIISVIIIFKLLDQSAIRETEEHQPKEVEEGTKATHTEDEEHVHTSSGNY